MAAGEHATARAGEDVRMKIDQAGGDVESSHIDYLAGLCGRDIGGNGGDLATFDSNVAHSADFVFAVDEMAAF